MREQVDVLERDADLRPGVAGGQGFEGTRFRQVRGAQATIERHVPASAVEGWPVADALDDRLPYERRLHIDPQFAESIVVGIPERRQLEVRDPVLRIE